MFTGAAAGNTHHQIMQCPQMLLPPIERRCKSTSEIAPNCPRCASSNTKFCYYNNYSLSQPRYFCKGCRRYWTKGGSLRNVPVGGGCRKNRRAKSASRLSERVSTNYSNSFSGFEDNMNEQIKGCSSDGDSAGQASGADIDMAAVFAKFLNDRSGNSDNFPEEFVSQEFDNISNSFAPDSIQNDPILEEFNGILVGEKQQQSQNFLEMSDMDNANAAFELQTLLDDEVVQDFSWQSVFPLQEFDSFAANHDQSLASSNPMNDNWSNCFDFPAGFEVYSRP